MRHFIPTFIIILLLASCVNSPVNLLGKVSSTKLFTTNGLFSQQHNTYRVPDADLAALSELNSDISLAVYFGEWCGDSQREVPIIIKSFASNPKVKVTLYALSLDKLEPSGKAKEKEIKFTPTMIIYDKGIEIGRIIERPKNSWVTDVVMLSKLINKAK